VKKTLVTLLALVFVLGIAGTALAAPANPFVDVPAKHWAYGAVAQLAKAGIVDGYGDGTFRGDRAMTRYEMAQVVAKAMAKSDKADAQQKALIDKLAVEFAAELNNLGVRVAKLEANASSIKFSGDARIRYFENVGVNEAGTTTRQQRFQERLRIYMDGKLADNVTFAGRLSAQNGSEENTGTVTTNVATTVDYAKFTFKEALMGADFSIGRDSLLLGYGLLSNGTGQYDSFKFAGGGNEVKFWVAYGDIASYLGNVNTATATANPAAIAPTNAVNVTTANLTWTPSKTFNMVGAMYWSNSNMSNANAPYPFKVYSFGAKWNFATDFWLTSEYAKNTADGTYKPSQRNAFYAQIGYKGANKAVQGSWGMFLNYKKYGASANDWRNTSIPVFENVNDGFLWTNGNKGWGVGVNYALAKNVIGTITYEDLKSYDGTLQRPKFTYAQMCFWF
jgi:hypothetical protein